jgi:hypothetical protein
MTQQIRYRHTRPTQRTNRRSVRWTEREREDLARMAPTRSCSRRERGDLARMSPRGVAPGAGDASALLLAHHTLCPLSHGRPPATPTHSAPLRWRSHPETTPGSFPPACGLVRDRSTAARSTYVCLDHARHNTPGEGANPTRGARQSRALPTRTHVAGAVAYIIAPALGPSSVRTPGPGRRGPHASDARDSRVLPTTRPDQDRKVCFGMADGTVEGPSPLPSAASSPESTTG